MKSKNTKLLWIDMEMTGLDVEKEVVIEVAAFVTDYDLNILDKYEAVINQPKSILDRMDDWNKTHHTQSGLLFKIPSGKSPEEVEEDLLNLVKRHWPVIEKKDDMPILCGNSIAQDRAFINKYFSNFASKLHYRMLDVTAWKIIFNQKFEIKYEKKNAHRAIDDLNESLEELRLYLKHIKI